LDFSIGLDKLFLIVYILIMVDGVLSRKAKSISKTNLADQKKDLLSFVNKQFRMLVKKNLQMPIKLYQL